MIFVDILFVIIIALVFTFLLSSTHYRREGFYVVLPFFLIFLLVPWAGILWIGPVGPSLFGGYWIVPLIIGFLIFISIMAFTPSDYQRRKPRTAREALEESEEEVEKENTINIFFWVLVLLLVVSIIIGYIVGGM